MTFAYSVQTMYSLMHYNPLALQVRRHVDMVFLRFGQTNLVEYLNPCLPGTSAWVCLPPEVFLMIDTILNAYFFRCWVSLHSLTTSKWGLWLCQLALTSYHLQVDWIPGSYYIWFYDMTIHNGRDA